LDQKRSWIGLAKNHGTEIYSACEVEWDFEQAKGETVWVSGNYAPACMALSMVNHLNHPIDWGVEIAAHVDSLYLLKIP
jgi:hypothetical protein